MTTTQIKNRGFTLVELLIVIVIIAILTVVSLVAYNGLQDQARTSTAKSAADSVAKKAELYNTDVGHYPESLTTLTGASSDKSYRLESTSVNIGSGTVSRPDEPNTVWYTQCGGGTGARIVIWDYSAKAASDPRTVGSC